MTSTKRRIADRQTRKRELGQRDEGCRCRFCRKVKPLRLGAFCSYDCERDAAEADYQRELMRKGSR